MPRNRQDVTDAELAILKDLWEFGPANIRDITARVYPSNSESDYATVKKLLARLEKKSFVSRDRQQIAHLFEAAISLDDLLAMRLQGLADNLCGGSQAPLLMHFLEKGRITRSQRKQLRELIDKPSESRNKRQGD